jgi:hypothetical protein
MSPDNNISYLNKSFSDFKANLTNYAKTYFPTAYNDFSDANPGAMFIEMASYVGDVMSFYLDNQIQENFLLYAKEKENLYAMSYALGYRPKSSYASSALVDVYQIMPSIIAGGTAIPDTSYGLVIPNNTTITSTSSGTKFLTTQQVDFTDTGSATITYYGTHPTIGNSFLVKKSVPAISAEIKSTTFTFTTPQKFSTAVISDTNIIQILDVTDSNGNIWYEVPYLAQSSIFEKQTNSNYNSDQVPYLLQLRRAPRRFVSRLLSDNTLQLEFGAGVSNKADGNIIPTPDNIKLGLVPGISNLLNDYNQASIFYTQEYGLAPSNTTLTVRYLIGGGITSNVPSNDLTVISTGNVYFKSGYSTVTYSNIVNSIISTNTSPSSGGRNGDEIEEIRNNALYAHSSQLRAVTKNDYIVRALSLPADYGSIAKVYVTQDQLENPQPTTQPQISSNNPLSLDLYVLAYNSSKQLSSASTNLKNNLVTYLNEYRMVTDAINIRDAFYINIGVNFDITIISGFNNQTVLSNCVTALKNFFNIESWQINQPIVISDIMVLLLQVKGVQSITKLEIVNKQNTTGITYSQYAYDIPGATRSGNIYTSADPSIFEVRYPNTDIQGRVVTY